VRRYAAIVAVALVVPAWADDEDWAREQSGRFLNSEPDSHEMEVQEPALAPEPHKLAVTLAGGVVDAAFIGTVPAAGAAAAVSVWSSSKKSWLTLLLEPRLAVIAALLIHHVTADLTLRAGINLYPEERFAVQLRAGLGPIGRVGIANPGFSVGLAFSGEVALAFRVFADERLLKFGCTLTGHHYVMSTWTNFPIPPGGYNVVGGISWESRL